MREDSAKIQLSKFIRQYLHNYEVERVRILYEEGDRYYACAYLGGYRGKVYVRIRRLEDKFQILSVEPT